MEGKVRNAFAFVRPPGHHAEGDRAAGFCLFNNVAIGAMHAVRKYNLERVLIVDWDLHPETAPSILSTKITVSSTFQRTSIRFIRAPAVFTK